MAQIADLIDWTIARGIASDDVGALVTGMSERLVAVGVPVLRMHVVLPTRHPAIEAVGCNYCAAAGLSLTATCMAARSARHSSPVRFPT
jgi:hypothetical protein